jgi:hypothetical protein
VTMAIRRRLGRFGKRSAYRRGGARGVVLALASVFAGLCVSYAAPPRDFDITSIMNGEMWQTLLLKQAVTDAGCKVQYRLSELEGDGEHTVYGKVALSEEVGLHLRVRAVTRYGVQVGFATQDWASYSLISLSLISGAYDRMEGGRLEIVGTSVVPRSDGWVDVSIRVKHRNRADVPEGASGYAMIKLTADGGAKHYRGQLGHGVELCASTR